MKKPTKQAIPIPEEEMEIEQRFRRAIGAALDVPSTVKVPRKNSTPTGKEKGAKPSKK